MKASIGLGLAALLAFGGCGNSSEEQAQQQAAAAAAQAQQAAAQAAAQAQQAAQQAQQAVPTPPAGGGGSNFGTVTLAPGFVPDPHVVQGTSGGNIQASTWNASCGGWVTQQPDHLFVASGAFGNLRIMTKSDSDTTLVVQRPDNTYACNDDTDGLNPVVEIANAPAGTYRIWIGAYQAGQNAAYKLGFSELSSVTPSSIP